MHRHSGFPPAVAVSVGDIVVLTLLQAYGYPNKVLLLKGTRPLRRAKTLIGTDVYITAIGPDASEEMQALKNCTASVLRVDDATVVRFANGTQLRIFDFPLGTEFRVTKLKTA